MASEFKNLRADEGGATAVEYALMVAAIAAIVISVVLALGVRVSGAFHKLDSTLAPYLP